MKRIHLQFRAVIVAALLFGVPADLAVAQHETSVLKGTVIGPDGSPVKDALIRGIYINPGRRAKAPAPVTGNAAGEFRLERKPAALWLIATTPQGRLAGQTQVPAKDTTVTIKLSPSATAVGRLIENDAPLAGAHLACDLWTQGSNRRATFTLEVATAETGSDGRFVFPGLLVGEQYAFRVKDGGGVTSIDAKGTTSRGGWFPSPLLKVAASGQTDWGYLQLPLPRRVRITRRGTSFEIDPEQLADIRFHAKTELATRISRARDDARLEHRKVMLILGDPKAEATQSLVALLDGLQLADDLPGALRVVTAALRNNLAQEAGIPEADVTKEFTRPLGDFERVPIDVTNKAAADHLTKTYSLDASDLVLPALAVLDDDGSIADLQSISSKGDPAQWDAKALRGFLKCHRLPESDAEELLTAARHRAGQENKRILLLESDARFYASRLLTRFIDEHRQLFDRDYVWVNIDAGRSIKGTEVIAQFRKSGASIPWMAILDAKGNKLSDSDGPAGNIGFPAEPAAINDFIDRMLKTTAQKLTPNELDLLRTALSSPQKTSGVTMSEVTLNPPRPPIAAKRPRRLSRAPIYNPKANAKDDIATALMTANRERKRVLIEFGGNWCGWCYRLYDVLQKNAEVSAILNQGFVLVLVDVSTNRALYEHYVEEDERRGVPFLTVLDADGKVSRNQPTGGLEKNSEPESDYDIAKLIAFLRQSAFK
jgi:thioredoxin family protein